MQGMPSASDIRICERITREHGKTFYFSTYMLPAEKRRAVWAVYAYCRLADDIVDRAAARNVTVEEAYSELAAWEAQLDSPVDAVPRAFALVRSHWRIDATPARDLLRGLRMDLDNRRYATWEELAQYCYCVASTVGLLVTPILGVRDERAWEYARDLGMAMQLTNILRDVGEDFRLGRVYLPLEDLERFGYPLSALAQGVVDDAFRSLMAFEIERARSYYRAARPGVAMLERSGQMSVLAASSLYGSILGRIESNDYDVFTRRAHLPLSGKVLRLPSILFGFLQLRTSSFG